MLLLMIVKTSRTIFALLLSHSNQPYAAHKEKDVEPSSTPKSLNPMNSPKP